MRARLGRSGEIEGGTLAFHLTTANLQQRLIEKSAWTKMRVPVSHLPPPLASENCMKLL
jgi:hypothetical protein